MKENKLANTSSEKRSESLNVMLTPEEKEMVKERAKEKGMPCNEYLISLCKANEELQEESKSLKVKAEKQNNFDVNFHNFYNDVKAGLTLEESLIKRYVSATGKSVTYYKILNWLRRQAEPVITKEERTWLINIAEPMGKKIETVRKLTISDDITIEVGFTDKKTSLMAIKNGAFKNLREDEEYTPEELGI